MIIEVKNISELKEAPYNPRKSNKKQDSNLKASLEKFGVVEPIVFNKRTGYWQFANMIKESLNGM